MELVRYVAPNPVRAGLVHSPEELDRCAWSGHAVLVGTRSAPWQDTEEVLGRFDPDKATAIGRYRDFVVGGWGQGRREDFSGGGLIRSAGGVTEVLRRRPEEREAADERILGAGAFVEAVWRASDDRRSQSPRRSWPEILKETAERFGVEPDRMVSGARNRAVCQARRAFFSRCVQEAGISMTQLGRLCAMSTVSVSRAVDSVRRSREEGQER